MSTLTLIPVLLQLLQSGLTLAPQLIQAAITEWQLFTSSTAPTAAQQATLDAALEVANNALQAA